MSAPYLPLLWLLLPLILALPAPNLLRQARPDINCEPGNPSCSSVVILKDGFARIGLNFFFDLSGTDFDKASDPQYEIVQGKDDNIISKVDFDPPSEPEAEHQNRVYSASVTFNGFPGRAALRVYINDSTGKIHSETRSFQVVGLVLYEMKGNTPHILTGKNPNRTVVRSLDDGFYGTDVNVSMFVGDAITSPVNPQDIRLIVNDYSDVLPWSPENCPIVAEPSRLGARCAMAFSVGFEKFYIRIAPGREVPAEIPVQFEWLGIREYQRAQVGEDGVRGDDEQPISLTDDVITSALVQKFSLGGTRDNGSTNLAGWQIGIIAATSVVAVVGVVTLVCCIVCGRRRSPKKPEPDVVGFKDKFQEIGFLRRSTLRRGDDNEDDDDQCYVEEPPTPDDSEILMLENESRGHRRSAEDHIEGLIPMDRLNEDKSVERLVLPPGVVRGVELESSTEGASAFDYGSRSGENDVTSYGRGMTSVPRDHFNKGREYGSSRDRSTIGSGRSEMEGVRDSDYLRDSRERIRSLERDRARIRELDREIGRERSARERSEERMRGQSSVEEFPDSGPVIDDRSNGVMSRSRGGVGAAINRIRQLDLLNGPASRGLVGRNGEPIQRREDEGRSGGDIVDIAGSALA